MSAFNESFDIMEGGEGGEEYPFENENGSDYDGGSDYGGGSAYGGGSDYDGGISAAGEDDGGISAPVDGDLPDGFLTDDDDDLDFGELQGYQDLNSDNSDNDEPGSLFFGDDAHPRTRPAFFSRSIAAAERAAIRTQADNADAFELIEDADVIAVPSRVPGTFGHSIRRKGGRGAATIAYHKPISADLDSDDELILNMRDKGYTDQQIADRLAREGRIRYDRKSISTRVHRIRLAQAAHVDTLLANGYKEWEYDDDVRLMQAFEFASMEVEFEIERARAWRFRKVSEFMRKLNKDSIWSEKACRERYQSLMNGTAIIPIDMDDDPDARRSEMEEFRERREREMAEERARKDAERAHERMIKEEARMRNALKAEEAAKRRAQKAAERSQRMIDRAAENQTKQLRAEQNRIAKIQKVEELKAERLAEKEAAEKAIRKSNSNMRLKVTLSKAQSNIDPDARDPRSDLSVADLKHLCEKRGVAASGDKAMMVKLLKEKDDKRSFNELRQLCRSKGLNTAGTKAGLNHQLAKAEATPYPSYHDAGLSLGDAE